MRVFSLLVLFLLPALSGCLGGDRGGTESLDGTGPDGAPGAAGPAAADGGFEPAVVYEGRLQVTGAGDEMEATFEVPEGASRVVLQTGGADDLAAGRFRVELESPDGRTWLVHGGYGYRSPVNNVVVGTSQESMDAVAAPGTWTLRANTDGHLDMAVVASVE